jgi:hypothetical protein
VHPSFLRGDRDPLDTVYMDLQTEKEVINMWKKTHNYKRNIER